MRQHDTDHAFAALALPHLDAAFNLARWLMGDEHDAQDVVQDAYIRAQRSFDSFDGSAIRPWLLAIVRNCCFSLLKKSGRYRQMEQADDAADAAQSCPSDGTWGDPVREHSKAEQRHAIAKALSDLPVAYREVIILREMEELDYRDIARIVDIPIGTVMSRLSRARSALRVALAQFSEDQP